MQEGSGSNLWWQAQRCARVGCNMHGSLAWPCTTDNLSPACVDSMPFRVQIMHR